VEHAASTTEDKAAFAPPPPAAPPIVTSLGPETALLESARTALGRGDASGAIALLERHEREFPAGALVEERLAAKVLALCSLGRREEAARTASRLLRLSPTSPLRARILDSCAYEH
jgi:RNA polymerase sigma-70 factor (ECF subfamily)